MACRRGHDFWASERLGALFPDTHVARVFNTIYFQHLADQGDPDRPMYERRALPMVASSSVAARTAWELAVELGFAPLDLGGLDQTRGLSQPGDLLYNEELTLAQARQRWVEAQGDSA